MSAVHSSETSVTSTKLYAFMSPETQILIATAVKSKPHRKSKMGQWYYYYYYYYYYY
jgi:hypothetical protein